MSSLARGLHECLVTEALASELETLPAALAAQRHPLNAAEAADRIALHLSRVLERAIRALPDADRAQVGVQLARKVIELVETLPQAAGWLQERPLVEAQVLAAVLGRRPDGTPDPLPLPLTPLLDTVLLANSPGEPRVGHEIATEIPSADRIDLIMAFIRYSGIRPLLDGLAAHCRAGKSLRILTTTYTGSTEARALDVLRELGAQVRVSYDTTGTRLHAKAWLFHRRSGFSTAYIGSSNLTHQAQQTGLEWNVRVSGARNPSVVEKIEALFESYWYQPDFQGYAADEFRGELERQRHDARPMPLLPTEIRLEPFQEHLLELIAVSREQGHHRNLLVAATGTGKTVMAAVDYQRLRSELPRARLLFVAHRSEILEQARRTFCQALRDPSFGELWVDGQRPTVFEHVFASIQSLAANGLEALAPDHFDVVIVDEFHHAAARSYQRLLDRVQPRELLGLTATPERTDGLPVLSYFDDRIAAELRLWDAIEQQRLVPFAYYGIYDDVDLREVAWHRGRGYDVDGLTKVLTADDFRARFVIQAVDRVVADIHRIRALGFCVSIAHARFMARVFSENGIPSTAIWSDTPEDERRRALRSLEDGKIRVLFSVDLFNEGVDLPAVDTLLMLRPTESATLFLQQLGRGLRRHRGKTACTVLDFVGQHRAEFRFDLKFRALLRTGRKGVQQQVEQGFPFLPAGCHMELERVAAEVVLRSLKEALPTRWPDRVSELRALASGGDLSLAEFLAGSGLELEDVCGAGQRSWSELREAAGLLVQVAGPHETKLRRAIGRLLHVDDEQRADEYRRLLESADAPDVESLTERERRLLRMLVASLMTSVVSSTTSLGEAARLLWKHPQVRSELLELLPLLAARRIHRCRPLEAWTGVPLQTPARYSRIEIQAALGDGDPRVCRPPTWREGVRWFESQGVDALLVTIDKTSGQFSPTTRYRDYAIDPSTFHWESQSQTRAASPTGQRYQRHEARGSRVLLFVRPTSDDAFNCLGFVSYRQHEGEMPMAVQWRLQSPMPGDLFAGYAAAVK